VIDQAKHRREFGRWVVLLALYNARPIGAYEEVLLSIMRGMWPDATAHEVRLALDYLGDRKLIEVRKEPSGRWFADLNRYGVDVVEYTVPCEPGIARPEKYT
jgi:hypothetical protein